MCLWSVQEVLYYLADGRGTHRLHGRYRGSLVFKRNTTFAKNQYKNLFVTLTHTHIRSVDHCLILLYDMREHWRHMSMSMSMSTMCPPSPRSICPEMCLYLLLYELCENVSLPLPLSLDNLSRPRGPRPLFCEVCICILTFERGRDLFRVHL